MNEAPTADGGPGFLAFLAFFLLAIALWFLMRNMNARMRRMSYRQQAAHRGKDEPQAGPGDLDPEAEGRADPASEPVDEASARDDGAPGADVEHVEPLDDVDDTDGKGAATGQ